MTYSPSDVKDVGTFVIRSSNIKDSTLISADNVYVNPNIANSEPVKKDDVIMVVRNGSKSLIGKHALVTRKIDNTVIGAFMTGIRSSTPYFLDALLDTINFKKEIYKNLGATINQITIGNLRKMTFKVPNKSEKFKIGNLFKKLNYLLALYERKLKLLSQVKKYFLDNLFAEKEYPNLRFKGFTDAWEQRKLSEMTQQVKRTSDSENPILTISAKNGWMDQKDRFNRVIAGKELKNYIELYKNELSYNHGNSKYAKFGIIYVQRKYEKALVPKVYHSFSMSYGDPRFIENLSLGHKLDKELSKLITSGARQDGLLNINKKSFYTIKLFIPSEQEQIKISNIMDVINHIITLHNNKKQNLIEIKKKLLNTMFI